MASVVAAPLSGARPARLPGLTSTWKGQLLTFAILLPVSALLALLLVATTVYPLRAGMKAIVVDSVPSVRYAGQIGGTLERMDGRVAAYLGSTHRPPDTAKVLEADDASVRQLLYLARQGVSYPGEAEAVDAMRDLHMGFANGVAIAMYEADAGRPQEALKAYLGASHVLGGPLQSKIEAVQQINVTAADQTWHDQQYTLAVHRTSTLGALLATALAFLAANLAAAWRTHRMVTPLLLAGTLLVVWFCGATVSLLLRTESELYVVMHDAFGTLQSIDELHHRGSEAHAALARWQVAPQESEAWASQFFTASQQVERLLDAVSRNVTFPGEADAFAEVQRHWDETLAAENLTQASLLAGQAVTGGADDAAFQAFTQRLSALEDINRREFDSHAARLQADLDRTATLMWVVLPLGALLGVLGLRDRMALL